MYDPEDETPAVSRMTAVTPEPPYYAVIFTSLKQNDNGYDETSLRMKELAALQPGFLGLESARDNEGFGITVSYWSSLESIAHWKQHGEHLDAQANGRRIWYREYATRIAKVERDYDFLTTK